MRIHRKTGSEGPAHDPYGYVEYTIDGLRSGFTIVYHDGFSEHLCILLGRRALARVEFFKGDQASQMMQDLTDLTLVQIERFYWRLRRRCPKCGGKRFDYHDGYPGETLQTCVRCQEIVAADFNEAAIR